MITAVHTQRPRESVRRDMFDRADLDVALESLNGLQVARDRLDDHSPAADDLVADLHAAFVRHHAELNDTVAPECALNRAVMGEVLGTDVYRELHQHTVDDPIAAGMAATAITNQMGPLFEKLSGVREAAEQAQAAEDALNSAMNQDNPGGDDAGGDLDARLDELRAALAAAEDALDQQLAEAAPRIGKAARQGVREAAERAESEASAFRSWGTDPGELARMDPDERIRLFNHLNRPEIQRIAAMFGRMKAELRAQVDRSFTNGPAEVHSVKLGNDLSLTLPSEFAYLAIPETRIEFFRRFASRQLLCWEVRERAKTERGPIVMAIDASSSMRGQRLEWAIALSLAFLSCAKTQQRGFAAIVFRGPGRWTPWEFVKPADFDLARMLELASIDASGGTEIQGPLTEAARYCLGDHETTGLEGADIVVITDGEVAVTDEWLDEFQTAKRTAGFRCWGIAIEQAVPPVLHKVADLAAPVADLVSSSDVSSIFQKVGQNYNPARSRA